MDYLFVNGKVFNSDSASYEPKSVLVSGKHIACLGTENECRQRARSRYEVINLNGKLLLPAFTDSHTHFVELAKSRILVNLIDCRSIDEIVSNLWNYREGLNWDPAWILGGSWDRNKLEHPELLNRHLLDKVFPNKPVALMSKDYHSKLCNSKALELAGINSGISDPTGGRIERDSHGNPTGILFETAGEMVDKFIVPLPSEQIVMAIQQSVTAMYPLGLVAFHSMESMRSRDLLLQAQRQGSNFRFCWHFPVDELTHVCSEPFHSYEGEGNYQIGGMKIFGDGSLGSQTAAMFAPYPGSKDNYGILRYSDAELFSLMQQAAELGFSSTIHAIGNKAVSQVIEATLKLNSIPSSKPLMHRIEHVQSIRQEDIERLKKASLFASVQPLHLANDVPMIEQYWHNIHEEVYSFGSLLQAGIPLGFGSDAPIESINPMLGIYSAVYRRPMLDHTSKPFRPSQALTPEQAIISYSHGAARASKLEQYTGSIAISKQADLIVLDDYTQQDGTYWLDARSNLTMFAGEIVYSTL